MSVAADFSARSDVTLQRYNTCVGTIVQFFLTGTEIVFPVSNVQVLFHAASYDVDRAAYDNSTAYAV